MEAMAPSQARRSPARFQRSLSSGNLAETQSLTAASLEEETCSQGELGVGGSLILDLFPKPTG